MSNEIKNGGNQHNPSTPVAKDPTQNEDSKQKENVRLKFGSSRKKPRFAIN
jgi:hypothetical protein